MAIILKFYIVVNIIYTIIVKKISVIRKNMLK